MRVLTERDPVMMDNGDLKQLKDVGGDTYTLPVASSETLGGVKVGENLTIGEDGTLNAEGADPYSLPIASSETLGGVKVGENLTIGEDGTLNASGGGGGGFTAFEWTPVSNSIQIVENNSIRIGDVLIVAVSLYISTNFSQGNEIIKNATILEDVNISARKVIIHATSSPGGSTIPSQKNMLAGTSGNVPRCLVIAAGESISSSNPYLTICGVLSLKDRRI